MSSPIAFDQATLDHVTPETAGFASDRKTIKTAIKSTAAYRTISETADMLGVPQHVLRFWETKFPQIRPMKRSGGRRYYGPNDIETLRTVQNFLYEQGYTIKGVQRLLRLKKGLQAGLHEIETIDDVVMNDELFDSEAVAEALMFDAPRPTLQKAEAEADIPSHLPSKPAALMAAGIEAGRPNTFHALAEELTVMGVAIETLASIPDAALAAPKMVLLPHQRARIEALLEELRALKALL